jgi:ferritin-like metal-binding protein YciE
LEYPRCPPRHLRALAPTRVCAARKRVAAHDTSTTQGGGVSGSARRDDRDAAGPVHAQARGGAEDGEDDPRDGPQLEEHAQDTQLKESLRRHYGETQQHVANLERAFELLGEEVDESACPAIEGLEKEGQANLKMVADSLNDDVIVSGVTETEHHEIAVYEGLITKADAMGEDEVVSLLEENLQSEEATLAKAQQLGQQLAERAAQIA